MAEKFNKVGDILKDPQLGRGTFIVVKTAYTGGGTGHGPHDVYPDGHQIKLLPVTIRETKKAKKIVGIDIDNRAREREYFQSGSFSNMIDYIEPLMKVKVGYAVLKG